GDVLGERGDPLELGVGVLVAAEDPLEVEHRETAELADHPRRLGRDDAVERRSEQWQLEPVGAERPADVDVVRIARTARRNDGDVVEPVGPPGLFSTPDFYFHLGIVERPADGRWEGRSAAMTAATIGCSDASSGLRPLRGARPSEPALSGDFGRN